MRLFELNSQYIGELSDATINLIYSSSAEGKDSLSTQDLIDDLSREGYMVNYRDLIDILKGNPIVKDISKDSIEIDTGINLSDDSIGSSDDDQQHEKNKNKVAAMAKKQLNKG
jgi:hypothetical protein